MIGDIRGTGGPAAPVVLVYGHYDVQPPGPGWSVPPFEPVRRGGYLLARGANDDKGQLAAVIAALRAWRGTGGPPCRVVVLAEGAEEIGSPGLGAVLRAVRRRISPQVVLVCDTERAADGVPAVTRSQRGRIDAEIVVDRGGVPVHSGRCGGAVLDPSLVLADVLHGLRAAVTRIPAPAGAAWSSHPAVSVTQLRAGGSPGAVPVRARARVDVRLPPGISAVVAAAALERVVREHRPVGVSVRMAAKNCYPGTTFDPAPVVLGALDQACRATFGASLRYQHSGASLPAAVQLAAVFGVEPVLLGLGTPDGGAHGPDERLDITGWSAGVELVIQFLAILKSSVSLPSESSVRIPR